jgi:hypothetical protein
LATFWNYRNLEKFAIEEKDNALVTALRLISVDERVHYNFFRNTVKEWMKYDEAGTIEDLKYVFEHFTMPGHAQIPGYDERARILARTGIYGPREYIKLVKNPVLQDLGLSKSFEVLEKRDQAAKAETEDEIEKRKREKIQLTNGEAVPKDSSPLNGISKYATQSTPVRSPMLEAVGFSPEVMDSLAEIAHLRDHAQNTPFGTEGSRGMPRLEELDQRLMAIGDEMSNNAEEMRDERKTLRKRVKNQRLLKHPTE